jgi:hypothetical protein
MAGGLAGSPLALASPRFEAGVPDASCSGTAMRPRTSLLVAALAAALALAACAALGPADGVPPARQDTPERGSGHGGGGGTM